MRWRAYWSQVINATQSGFEHLVDDTLSMIVRSLVGEGDTTPLSVPFLYDFRFENQGGDKQSHALLLQQFNTRFLLVKNHFLIHLRHQRGDAPVRKGVKQVTRSHLTLSMMNYFDTFLPTMEQLFGNTFRWDTHCPYHWLREQERWTLPFDV
jgi:hypothetical protein